MIPREVNKKQAFGSASVHTKASLTEATFFILCVICLSRHGSKLLQTTLSQESYKTESRGSSVAPSTQPRATSVSGLLSANDYLLLKYIWIKFSPICSEGVLTIVAFKSERICHCSSCSKKNTSNIFLFH